MLTDAVPSLVCLACVVVLELDMSCTADEVALPKATVNKFVNEIAGGLGTCFPAGVFRQLCFVPGLLHVAPLLLRLFSSFGGVGRMLGLV